MTGTERSRGVPALHVVGPNPALDRLQVVETFTPFGVNRAQQVISRAGGKSLIVARAARRLGGAVTLHGFTGGPAGDVIEAECRAEGISDRHVRIAGETRTTVVVVEAATGRTTVLNEPGPEIRLEELQQFERRLQEEIAPGDLVLLTGSLPRGVPSDLYARVIALARDAAGSILVDASGEPLVEAAAAAPDVLKVNVDEFDVLQPAGQGGHRRDDGDEGSLAAAMERVRRSHGIGTVIVTRGSDGCLATDGRYLYRVSAPVVKTVNATGSGDCFFAALALTMARQVSRGAPSLADALRAGAAAGAANAARLAPEVGQPADVLDLIGGVQVHVRELGSDADRTSSGRRP